MPTPDPVPQAFRSPVCAGSLPTIHAGDITYIGQLVRMRVTLADLPYSLPVVFPRNVHGSPTEVLPTRNTTGLPRVFEELGGMPIALLLESRAADALQATGPTVTLKEAGKAPASVEFTVDGDDYKVALSATDRESLLAGRPVVFAPSERTGGRPVMVVPAPSAASAQATATSAITSVGPVGSGNSNPRVHFVPPPRTLPPAASLEVALYLSWSQTWTLQGYSKGRLLNSLTLAPAEELTIEVFSWDRTKRTMDVSSSIESEQQLDAQNSVHDQADTMQELTRTSEFSSESQLKVGLKFTEIPIGIDASLTQHVKDQTTRTARLSTQRISDSTQKATQRLKAERTTKVSVTSEIGSEERVTRKIRNINQGRTLSVDYFELQAHYRVQTALTLPACQLCLLVPNPIQVPLNRDTLRTFEGPLSRALRQPELMDGFRAARALDARDKLMRLVQSERAWAANLAGTASLDAGRLAQANAAVSTSLKRIKSAMQDVLAGSPWELFNTAPGNYFTDTAVLSFRRFVYKTILALACGDLYDSLCKIALEGANVMPFINSPLMGANYFVPSMDENEQLALLGASLDLLGTQLAIRPEDLAARQTEMWHAIAAAVRMAGNPTIAKFNGEKNLINTLSKQAELLDDAGVATAVQRLAAARKRIADLGAEAAVDVKAREDEALQALGEAYGLRDTAEAMEREQALLAHLNRYAHYYRFKMFEALTPSQQLDELGAAGDARALLVPTVLGYAEGNLIFPVDVERDSRLKDLFDQAILQNAELTAAQDERDVVLPTPGVAAETRLGDCEGLEPYLVDLRNAEVAARQEANRQAAIESDRRQALVGNQDYREPTMLVPPLHVTVESANT